jgi:FAD/FMN-containing dehydrogenase
MLLKFPKISLKLSLSKRLQRLHSFIQLFQAIMTHEDELATLRRFARGPVLTKEDAELYDAARECFNRGLDERPEIIVQCQGANDVKRALAYCRATGISFTVAAGNLL